MSRWLLKASRVYFVLALLLATPVDVSAEAARPAVAVVAPIFQTHLDDLGSAPHTVTISRIIFTPGAGDEAVTLPGPRLVLVEAGSLAFHASGDVIIIHTVTSTGPQSTSTPTPVPTPTPERSPTTDVLLNPGDAVPVPIWTMHAFRNEGDEPAVVLDIRVISGDAPLLPIDLDVEILAQESGVGTLPTGRASLALGQSTVAAGGMVLAPLADQYQLVADAHGDGRVEPATDGSVPNPAAAAVDIFVLAIAPAGGAGRRGPAQPAMGPGGAEIAFDRVVATHYGPEELGFWLYEPAAPHPGTPLATTAPLPVVLFLGGCCATHVEPYYANSPLDVQAWLDHLTLRGAIVIYPVVRGGHGPEDTLATMREAVAELGNGNHVDADWSRFAVIGYSFGGWNAPLYAAASAAEGLPVPQAIFSTVAYDPEYSPDLSTIAADTRVIVLVDDDRTGWSDHGARRIWAALTTIPADRRVFVRLVSDFRGIPSLIANHQLPATGDYGTTNALDWYGTWKLGDALLSCTFADQDCQYAFGDTSEQRFMGYWSDGVPVDEIEVIADPGPPDPITPTPTA